MRTLKIGDRVLGPGHPAWIIAELSGNHGGRLDQALELLREAAKTGADAVKLQAYKPETITLDVSTGDFAIPQDNAWAGYDNLYKLYEYAHTPWEWFPALFEEAARLGMTLFGSVFDETAVDELEKFPVPAYKIASPEIVDFALLEKVARTGKPVIVSTGLASLEDITAAVSHLKACGCNDIILLKCTTAYPTPPEEANLKTIANIEETFGCLAGFSDHTEGMGVPIAAVAMGARVIEKHVKLDGDEDSVDSFFSLGVSEFRSMVTEIRRAEKAIGTTRYELTPEALKNRHGKRSLYVSAPIGKGDRITQHNIKSVRPGYGMDPRQKHLVIGRKAACDLVPGDRLSWEVVD